MLVDAAAAVLLRCVQSSGSQRWRRLSRDTAAAIQSIDEALQASVRKCDQASNNAKLQEAQVCWVQGQLPVFFWLIVRCIHVPLAGKCVAAAARLTRLRGHSYAFLFHEFTAINTASISK
jgi:hypothetical protein